ncbi:MAG: prepilin peptidase [Caldisphaera sp.]
MEIIKMLPYFLVALNFAVFIPASILDIKYREVPLWVWYIGSKTGIVLSIIAFSFYYPIKILLVYYTISILSVLGLLIAYLIGHMGAGDLWGSIFLALSLPINPFGGFLPPILLTLLIASVLELLTRTILTLRDCKNMKLNKRCFSAAPIRAKDLLNNKKYRWYFAQNSTKNISVDEPHETIVEESNGNLNEIVWAQPGLPYILFILISLPISLIVSTII